MLTRCFRTFLDGSKHPLPHGRDSVLQRVVHSSLLPIAACVSFCGTVKAQDANDLSGVEARIRAVSRFVDVGRAVWVEFSLVNTTDRTITLSVPGGAGGALDKEMGLPFPHIFSGEGAGAGLSIVNLNDNSSRANLMDYARPANPARIVLAPRASVGQVVDLLKFYPTVLRVPGRYRVTWSPYGGRLISNPVTLDIAPLQQAEIHTDYGILTLRFYYDDAPQSVANFLELARDGFYNGTPIHVTPGHFMLCGDPVGDGTGIRRDGRKLPPEFNQRPHQKGSVSMALLEDDPNSASCQFFICNTRHADWDGRYTVFAQLIGDASFVTLDQIMNVSLDSAGAPVETLRIRSVRLTNLRPEWADLASVPGAESIQTTSK